LRYPHTDAFSSLLSRAPIGPIPPPIWFALVTSDLKMRVKTFFEMSVPVRQTSQKALNIRLSLSLFSLFFYSDLPTNHCRIWSHTMTHTHTHTYPFEALWTSDQPHTETPSTWQHTTLTKRQISTPCRDSNPQSQQASGQRPTPKTA